MIETMSSRLGKECLEHGRNHIAESQNKVKEERKNAKRVRKLRLKADKDEQKLLLKKAKDEEERKLRLKADEDDLLLKKAKDEEERKLRLKADEDEQGLLREINEKLRVDNIAGVQPKTITAPDGSEHAVGDLFTGYLSKRGYSWDASLHAWKA